MTIPDDPLCDRTLALQEHALRLRVKQMHSKNASSDSTEEAQGEKAMSDRDKFSGFKKELLDKHEQAYGKEARKAYGDEEVDVSNAKLMRMSEESFAEFNKLDKEILEKLVKAEETRDPASDLAQEVARLHKSWLLYTWPSYTKEAHATLAQMYVDDPRFGEHYLGKAEFLRDAIQVFTGIEGKKG